MNRWYAAAAQVALAFSLGVAAHAQSIIREAPADVRPARMTVGNPPEIALDGTADRLSPGARIRDLNNLAVLSGSLAGKTVPVLFRRDQGGMVHEVWLLTEAEYVKLGGIRDMNTPAGVLAFNQMLALIFGARR